MCGKPEQTSGGQPNSNQPPEKQIKGSLETKNMIITPGCPSSPLLSPQAKRGNQRVSRVDTRQGGGEDPYLAKH